MQRREVRKLAAQTATTPRVKSLLSRAQNRNRVATPVRQRNVLPVQNAKQCASFTNPCFQAAAGRVLAAMGFVGIRVPAVRVVSRPPGADSR